VKGYEDDGGVEDGAVTGPEAMGTN